MPRLEHYTFEFHQGKLCKDKLRARPNNDVLVRILQQIVDLQDDKIDSYIGALPNEYGGGHDAFINDVLLLVKLDNAAGYKPIVIKNANPGIYQCMEYEHHMNETVEYTISDYVQWNVDQLLIYVNDTYKNKLYQFLEKKYNIVEDEIVLFH